MIETWRTYLDHDFPAPSEADRRAVEDAVGYALPEAYWAMVAAHQGQVPVPDRVPRPDGRPDERIGVFLHALPPERLAGTQAFGYGVAVAQDNLSAYYPAGIVPFSDDTGGNNMAFDFRTGPDPAIVFVNHEVEGEDGLIVIAPSFDALLAMVRA